MISTFERQEDILKLISQLDISPTMYRNADEKYHALAKFLEDCGIEADIYPQGSFALGTVVRPSAKDPNAAYDLDFICQLKMTKDDISPSELRRIIETVLKSSDRYSGKLVIYKECFTIEYSDINGVNFKIDIVPAVDENIFHKKVLALKSDRPDLLGTAIAIPRHNGERNYDWLTNNPHGFRKWFDEINRPFLTYNRETRRQAIFKEHRTFFNSVDDIPEGLERSAMQRVIQILKYHRDVFYLKLNKKDSDDLKPISAIINTLVAEIASFADPSLSVFELLGYVLNELNNYSPLEDLTRYKSNQLASTHSFINRSGENNKWEIQNPANPEDNLANKWNQNANIPHYFFLWLAACKQDLIQSLSYSDHQFRICMENAFGSSSIQKSWSDKYKTDKNNLPQPIKSSPRPYRK